MVPERHDLLSQETHAARWIGFRQPVRAGTRWSARASKFNFTYEAHGAAGLGEVWEEDEFWIELSWRIDPDGTLGIRKYFESPFRAGEKLTVEDFYRWIFENSVPGLPAAAAKEGLEPLAYMRKYGAFLIEEGSYRVHEKALPARDLKDAAVDPASKVISRGGAAIGVEIDGDACAGFPTPSRKLEFYSQDAEGLEMARVRSPELHQEPASIGVISIGSAARCCCCRRFGCRRWCIRVPATPSGYTKYPIATRCG